MADEPTSDSLNDALQHAHAEIDAMRASAAQADAVSEETHQAAIVHEVEGAGRYAVPNKGGWRPWIETIRDPEAALGFSPQHYPFDALVLEGSKQEPLADAKHAFYGTPVYVGLRENIAAVRNFLMLVYYTDTPDGMTAESATQALQEIARYVGDGLRNNPRAMGIGKLPFPDPNRAFIDLREVAKPDGVGAQYLYERILEMNRQSDWVRPFSAIVALFDGTANSDWMLPGADTTPFHDIYDTPLTLGTLEEIDAAELALVAMEDRHSKALEEADILATAADLDAMGNQLIHLADALRDVREMSEPVRQDAIEIAKDILRKLKISIGEMNVLEGLGLKPRDELGDLGGIRAVATVYERLLAWGRGIDPTIMQHPSILAATQAIGQIGALAKKEALRIAQMAGNKAHATQMSQQLAQLPETYTNPSDKNISGLLDKVERGIDTVLNRVVTINGPGAMVGHSRSNELGSYMSGTPIAGMSMQTNIDGLGNNAAKQQVAMREGQVAAQRAQVQRVAQQAARQLGSGNTSVQPTQARGGASAQLAAIRQRILQARRTATTLHSMQGVRSSARRNAMLAHEHHDDHHHDHHAPDPMAATLAKLDPRVLNSIKQMNSTTAGLTSNPVVTGRAAFEKMKQANTYGMKGNTKPMTEEEKAHHALNPPTPPKKDGRGF